jgi:hypothetical protein
MASIAEPREALSDYPRPATAALGTIEVSDANRGMVERRRALWAAYLRCEDRPQSSLATQYVPLLLDMILTGSADGLPAVPGSLYPPGFRQQVLAHTAFPADAIGHVLSAEDESTLPFLAQLRAMLEPDSDYDPPAFVPLVQLLNVLGLPGVAIRALSRRAVASGDPLFIYEVARSAYGLEQDDEKAIKPFHLLAAGAGYPMQVRLSAYARLIAHYCRRDRDLTACGEVADAAQRLVEGLESDEFAIRLGISRIYRALALYAVRRRDSATVASMMRATLDISRALGTGARNRAEQVAAGQDERLGLEASLKAFISSKGKARVMDLDAGAAVDRLLELDPWDPYTQLYTGDTLWMLGQDERALERYEVGGTLGTYPGTLAAQRAAVVLRTLGRLEAAAGWSAIVAELDPAAGAAA